VKRLPSLAALLAALLASAAASPARAAEERDPDAAARESAERISAELDRTIRETRWILESGRSPRTGTIRLAPGTVLFMDGAEVPLDQFQWAEPVQRRRRGLLSRTDTLLRVNPGVTLSLANLAGDIRVVTWDRNEVRVQAEHDRTDRLVTELKDAMVRLGVRSRNASPAEVEWTLTVPEWLPLELSGIESEIAVSGLRSSVRAQSMRGDVMVVDCRGPLEVNSVEGEVHVADVNGNVTAGSVNNVVRILRVVGPVEAQSINGDIQLEKVESRSVDASTVNGRVYYASKYQPRGRYSFSSHNGRVVAPVPTDQIVNVSLSSFQGEVESSIPVPAPRAKGHSYRFHLVDGVAVPEPPATPVPPRGPRAPRAPRAPGPSQVTPAPSAPEVELESFAGLIRLASQQDVLEALAARRAALDSARTLYSEGRRKMEQARRMLREARARDLEAKRQQARDHEHPKAPQPETPPPMD
jgi:hypothetical protein